MEIDVRYWLLTTGVAAIVASGSAFAADLSTMKAPPPAPAPAVYDWSGFYIGGTAGGAWTDAGVGLNPVNGAIPNYPTGDLPALIALGSPSLKEANAIFGGKLGYNLQSSAWVFGLEGDLSSFRFNRSAATTGDPFAGDPPPDFAAFNSQAATTWLATLRPRLGFAVDRALFYGTAGVAFGNVSFSSTETDHSPWGGGADGRAASSASQTKVGWTVGAGVDYALAANWVLSVEYLHVDLGSIKASGVETSGNGSSATLNFSTWVTSDLARVGVGYKF